MRKFRDILALAEERKGGEAALAALMPTLPPRSHLKEITDDRYLSAMAKSIFQAGFVWRVIENKWPGFEEAFDGFEVGKLMLWEPDRWEALVNDTRIVRNGQKIMAVAHNMLFVAEVAAQNDSFGSYLHDWQHDDQMGLQLALAKRGSRLGGNSSSYFLRRMGYDCYILSRDVVAGLRRAGLDLKDTPGSKREKAAIQAQFNDWQQETCLPYAHLSRTLSCSIDG